MSRYYAPSSEEHQPVFWFRGYGVYAAHLIVIVYCASMLATTLAMAFKAGAWFQWLGFESGAVLRGQVWRPLTYGLLNPPGIPFAIEMFMLGWFGRDVERHFGRRLFLWLFACLYLLSPLLCTAVGIWTPTALAGATGSFAMFIAFAALFPDAMMLFNIAAKWMALALVGIMSLSALAGQQWVNLLTLWATCGFALGFVRWQQGRITLPDLRFWRRPKLRVLPDLTPEERAEQLRAKPTRGDMTEVDAILDKIADSGFDSLTPKEKARLEAARADMLSRKGR